ncbi:MAG: hypothetical protein J6K90_03075 [Tidjanibacter sp.]|nr:hypothetical protein [Tidjanibacter sp.]
MKQNVAKREISIRSRAWSALYEMFFDEEDPTLSQESRRNKRIEKLLQAGLVMFVLVVLHLCLPMA